jgi:putative flippase GtrA
VILMRALAGWAGWPTIPANLLAIAVTSLLNFWAERTLGVRHLSALRTA